MKSWSFCIAIALLLGSVNVHGTESIAEKSSRLDVYYPKPERDYEKESWYPLVLLKFALEHSGYEHTLQESVNMVQSRSLKRVG